jgi:hypothetical protein
MRSLHKLAISKMKLLDISVNELPVIYKHEVIDALVSDAKPTSNLFMIMSPSSGGISEEQESVKFYTHMHNARFYQGCVEIADIVKNRLHKFCGLSREEKLDLIAKADENTKDMGTLNFSE